MGPFSRSPLKKGSGLLPTEIPRRKPVTLTADAHVDYFPCPICRGLLPVRTDRKGKPYVHCDRPCGLQMFVRGREGIQRLSALLARPGNPRNVYALSQALEHFAYLGDLLRETRDARPLLGRDPDLELREEIILMQRKKLEKFLRRELGTLREEMQQMEETLPDE